MIEVLVKGLPKHIEEAVIRTWFFEEGDPVTAGDDLAELITADESVIVISASATGVLTEVNFDEGDTVQRDEVVCSIDDEEAELKDADDDSDDDDEDDDEDRDEEESDDDY